MWKTAAEAHKRAYELAVKISPEQFVREVKEAKARGLAWGIEYDRVSNTFVLWIEEENGNWTKDQLSLWDSLDFHDPEFVALMGDLRTVFGERERAARHEYVYRLSQR